MNTVRKESLTLASCQVIMSIVKPNVEHTIKLMLVCQHSTAITFGYDDTVVFRISVHFLQISCRVLCRWGSGCTTPNPMTERHKVPQPMFHVRIVRKFASPWHLTHFWIADIVLLVYEQATRAWIVNATHSWKVWRWHLRIESYINFLHRMQGIHTPKSFTWNTDNTGCTVHERLTSTFPARKIRTAMGMWAAIVNYRFRNDAQVNLLSFLGLNSGPWLSTGIKKLCSCFGQNPSISGAIY